MISDVHTGKDVLEWLGTDDAAQQARRLVGRCRFGSAEAVADDVLQDACVAVLRRMQRGPLEVQNPGGYGTQVLKREVQRIIRGRYDTDELPADDEAAPDLQDLVKWIDPTGEEVLDAMRRVELLDELRVAVERTRGVKPWVISAMLSVVTLRAHPDTIDLPGVPAPIAGAREDQAVVWPALWFAGKRDHFPEEGDSTKERNRRNKGRSRMIQEVIEHYNRACRLFESERVTDHG